MKQERARSNAGMQPASEEAQEQRSAKSQVDVASIVQARNKLSVEDSVGERGTARMKPTRGPDAPTSKSARAVRIGERIRMKAPNVPISDGKGMKKG